MRYLKYFIGGLALAIVIGWVTRYKIISETPPFILSKFEELKSDPLLMDSIGGFNSFEYSYNEADFNFGDTLRYTIKINGNDRGLIYNAVQLRISAESWKLTKETLLIE